MPILVIQRDRKTLFFLRRTEAFHESSRIEMGTPFTLVMNRLAVECKRPVEPVHGRKFPRQQKINNRCDQDRFIDRAHIKVDAFDAKGFLDKVLLVCVGKALAANRWNIDGLQLPILLHEIRDAPVLAVVSGSFHQQ
jgi:hypothetical protein